jgi:hypothetical protein
LQAWKSLNLFYRDEGDEGDKTLTPENLKPEYFVSNPKVFCLDFIFAVIL